jgi:hypothetical protein
MFLTLEKYMLPCFSKTFFGVDCLGCGLQRSFLFIINGDLWSAFKMYPAIFTLLLLFTVVLVNFVRKNKISNKFITRLAYLNLSIILINYIIKINI